LTIASRQIARRAAIRKAIADRREGRPAATRRAAPTPSAPEMPSDLLAACVAAGGFDANDALGYAPN
jgi:hypothetical protein